MNGVARATTRSAAHSSKCSFLTSLSRVKDGDSAGRPVDANTLAGPQTDGRVVHPDHGGNAILAGNHGAVRDQPSDLGHEPRGDQEQRGPRRVRPTAHQDLSRRELRGSWIQQDRKSTRLNSSHGYISYAVFCFKK